MKDFNELSLNDDLVKALEKQGITKATKIQEIAIPLALEGKNIMARSETGTGKTLAYLIPVIERIDTSKRENQAIILAPTHELAVQINNTIVDINKELDRDITSTTLVGSGNIKRQMEKLKNKPHIIVGSSGRILELIVKKKITAHTIKMFVMDEGDKLLHFKSIEEVNSIRKTMQRDVQKLLFSATLTEETINVANKIIEDYELVQVEESNKVNEDIEHTYFVVDSRDKDDTLRKLIHASKTKKALVFVNRNYDLKITLEKLRYHKIKVEALHGENSKESRKNALEAFRNEKVQVLIASDVAARGLDIKGLTHIINLDIPEDSKNYLHRAGRVGRAGEHGYAYSIVDKREEYLIERYEKNFGIEIEKKYIYDGEIVDKIIKKPYTKKKTKLSNSTRNPNKKSTKKTKKNSKKVNLRTR